MFKRVLERGHNDGKVAGFQITVEKIAVPVAGQPDFDPVRAVDPWITPVDIPRGGEATTRS